jgi:hypothetical protein
MKILFVLTGLLAMALMPFTVREIQYQVHHAMLPWHTLPAQEHAPLTAEQAAYLESME